MQFQTTTDPPQSIPTTEDFMDSNKKTGATNFGVQNQTPESSPFTRDEKTEIKKVLNQKENELDQQHGLMSA